MVIFGTEHNGPIFHAPVTTSVPPPGAAMFVLRARHGHTLYRTEPIH